MIPINEAKKIIDDNIVKTTLTEPVSLEDAFGRALAYDAKSDVDVPPFNRATMDGYAVVSSDGAGEYEVIEYVPAGVFPTKKLEKGYVTRIMTGAPVPEGADAVVQVEKTGGFVEVGEKAEIKASFKPGQNISPHGEDVKTGDTVLEAGSRITAPESATLATAGHDPVTVFKLPTVAILSTGDEVIEPSEKPVPGQIRNSNAYSLKSQAVDIGLNPDLIGVAHDTEEDLTAKIMEGAKRDFLLVSGGVSAGDRDMVPRILEKAGYKILLHKVAVKPGKPLVFGVAEGPRYVFGVPGNPVSGLVIFELFIKPAILKWMGFSNTKHFVVNAPLADGFKRKKADRVEYIPVQLEWTGEGFIAHRIKYHGSGHMHALTRANGLYKIPKGVTEVAPGHAGEVIVLKYGWR